MNQHQEGNKIQKAADTKKMSPEKAMHSRGGRERRSRAGGGRSSLSGGKCAKKLFLSRIFRALRGKLPAGALSGGCNFSTLYRPSSHPCFGIGLLNYQLASIET